MAPKSSAIFFVTTPRNMEPMLAQELEEMGFSPDSMRLTGSGVEVRTSIERAYQICLWSRLANSVLYKLHTFDAPTPEALYEGCRQIKWWEILDADQSFVVSCTLQRAQIEHSHYAALKVKDAIVDQFRDRTGRRPSVDRDDPDLYIHVHVSREQGTVYLDLSGESLHKRSYRVESVPAPLKENVAAAALIKAGWPEIAKQGGALMDPMCGSGTFLIEGAFMAADIAPGLGRARFGFERWRDHKAQAWAELIEQAQARKEAGLELLMELTLLASDKDARAVRAARENVMAAGLEDVMLLRRSLDDIKPPEDFGLLITNPPYGERLGEREEAERLHVRLGELLVERFMGWKASVITADDALGKKICLRATKRHKLYNGPIECSLLHFDVSPERVYRPTARPDAE